MIPNTNLRSLQNRYSSLPILDESQDEEDVSDTPIRNYQLPKRLYSQTLRADKKKRNPHLRKTPNDQLLDLDDFAPNSILNSEEENDNYPNLVKRISEDIKKEISKVFRNILPPLIQLFLSNDKTTKIEAIIDMANKFNLSDTIKEIIDLLDNYPNGQ